VEKLEKASDAFLSNESRVAVIKGEWGVGKTYLWENYVSNTVLKGEFDNIAYSYVSLFGKGNLNEVRQSVFHSAKPLKTEKEIENRFDEVLSRESSIFDRLPWVRDAKDKASKSLPTLGFFFKHSKDIPILKQYSSLITSLEYGMINNYLVCFDDLERKSDSLKIKELMGLVDELAQRKGCKVILIFNEKSLDNDKDRKDFKLYREKIVDLEVVYDPSHEDNLQCVIDISSPYYKKVLNLVIELDIKNIRVLKKIKWVLDTLWESVDGHNDQLSNEFLTHVIVLCWSYYGSDKTLSYSYILEKLSGNSWGDLFGNEKSEKSEEDKTYDSLRISLSLQGADYDKIISNLLEYGYTNQEIFQKIIIELSEASKENEARNRINKAWNIYTDTFDQNLEEFLNEIKSIIEEDMEYLRLSGFSSLIDILDENEIQASGYIDSYVELHNELLSNIDPNESWGSGNINNEYLRSKVSELYIASKNINIDDVAIKLATSRGWNPDDIEYLCSLDEDFYYQWMQSTPEDMVTKIRSGLLLFRRMQTSNEEEKKRYKKITSDVVSALRRIGSESELNKNRVRNIYEIEVD